MVVVVIDHHTRVRSGALGHRASTADERAEFIELLSILGAGAVRADRGEQVIRCWNSEQHAHGDRRASLSVNPERSIWCCHGCGRRGGLVALRRAAGRERHQRSRSRHLHASAHLRALASPGADVLAHIPPAAIEALQRRTGRYKRREPLQRHLRALLAALVVRIDAEHSTRRVRFGQVDAMRCGVHPVVWSDLLDLLVHLGCEIERGQSGRLIAPGEGRGKHGALIATVVSISDNPLPSTTSTSQPDTGRVIRVRPEETLRASLAIRAPRAPVGPSLSRSPALASLLATFGRYSEPRAATGGTGGEVVVETLTIADLVATFGAPIRRTLRRAEVEGLVRIVRAGRSHGLVALTDLGEHVLDRDHLAGAERMEALADARERSWASLQERHRPRCARPRDAAPYRPHAPGLVIHEQTGEIVSISALRGAR